MALDTIEGVSALNSAHFVLNSTSPHLIPAYSSQSSSFEETWVLPRFYGHLVQAHNGAGGVSWYNDGGFQRSTSVKP
jgi:hypothetical protein